MFGRAARGLADGRGQGSAPALGDNHRVSARPGESAISGVSGKTLIEVNGLWAALLIVLPIIFTTIALIASLPGATHPRIMLILRWAAFALMVLFCAAGILSIGIFYIPAAIGVFVAATTARSGA